MQISITGRHLNLTAGEKDNLEEKLEKYQKKVGGLTKIEAIINLEGDRHNIEIILHIAHSNPLVANAVAESNATAVDLAVKKLDNLVSKLTGKLRQREKPQFKDSF